MIDGFRIPHGDALEECLLFNQGTEPSVIDAAIFISTKQSESFYSDILQFWVRAFFCFVEDMRLGTFFRDAATLVECEEISVEEFRDSYLGLIDARSPDSHFAERQQYPESRMELYNRSFFQAYVVLDRPTIKSAVAASDGEFVAYFQTVPKAHN
jgi:hypothetical protein